MRLSYLFERCLNVHYTRVADHVDYAIERVGTRLFLYLESSNGAGDWKSNLDFPAAAYRRRGQTVFSAHRGFLEAFRLLEPHLREAILDPQVHSVRVVGYSHGAALGVLAHEYIWYHRRDLRPHLLGYGFGCPRVLFGGRRASLAERWEGYTVIRNMDDLITHLPPAALGYYHVGRLLEIGERGRYSRIDAHRPENILAELRRTEKEGGAQI